MFTNILFPKVQRGIPTKGGKYSCEAVTGIGPSLDFASHRLYFGFTTPFLVLDQTSLSSHRIELG